ncbi:MAG: hypothetical protein AAF802_02515 [Planctomycetota bacterium]
MLYLACFAALLALMAWLSWKRPVSAVALVVCMYGIEQFLQAKSTYFVQHGSYVNIGCAAVVMLAFARLWHQQNLSIQTSPSFWLCLVLILFSYASFLWARSDPSAKEQWRGALPYLFTFVGITPFLVESPRRLRIALGLTLVLGACTCFALFFGVNWSARGIELSNAMLRRGGNSPGATGAPLAIAELGGTIAIIASLMNFPRVPYWKILKWVIILLGLAVVFRTQSRGQVMATFIVILMFQPVSGRPVGTKSIFAGLGLTALLALVFYVLLPIMDTNRWINASRSLNGRMRGVRILYNHMIDNPETWIFGNGAGSSWRLLNTYPHNVPVEIVYESGLVGLVFFGSLIYLLFRRIIDFTKDHRVDPEVRPVLATAFALFTFFLLISCKQGSLYSSVSMLMFGIISDRLSVRFNHLLPEGQPNDGAWSHGQQLSAAYHPAVRARHSS